ncbi:MAG TPA: helix-turn-helix transcriptional regulator, partial [Phycisphaerae bacterium]
MNRQQTELERFISDPEGMRLFQQERLILDVTEAIYGLMEQKGVNKADLAKRLGTSKAYVTRLLGGRTNMTLRTASDAFWALDASMRVSIGPLSADSGSDPGAFFSVQEVSGLMTGFLPDSSGVTAIGRGWLTPVALEGQVMFTVSP